MARIGATLKSAAKKVVKEVARQTIEDTLVERGGRYGSFITHAVISQELTGVMHDAPKWDELSPSQKEALEMVAHKIGRILNGDPNYVIPGQILLAMCGW